MRILSIDDIPWDKFPVERKKRVFCRVDYNVPLKNGKVLDDYRIKQSLPTLKRLKEIGCVTILGAHLGRPQKVSEQKRKDELSLLPIAEHLAELLGQEVVFCEDVVGSGVRKLVQDGRPGSFVMIENLRFDAREEKDDAVFAEKLFENADVFINDAFGACHRAHASIHAVAKVAKFRAMGYLLKKEYESLHSVLEKPTPPQVAILGGAKLEDKIKVIEKLMKTSSAICLGGRMGLAFLAAEGISLGASQFDKESIQTAKRLMADAKKQSVQLLYPVDGKTGESLDAGSAETVDLSGGKSISEEKMVLDIGPQTLLHWRKVLDRAKSVIWNGPMGVFENPCFAEGTLQLVDYLVEKSGSIQTVAGGGETVAAVTQRGALEKLFHVSTGGGAMLEFLEGRELPGLEILKLREREIEEIREARLAS